MSRSATSSMDVVVSSSTTSSSRNVPIQFEKEWQKLKNAPPVQKWCGVAILDEQHAVLLGGFDANNHYSDAVTIVNVKTGESKNIARLSQQKKNCTAIKSGGKLLAFGGYKGRFLSDLEVLDMKDEGESSSFEQQQRQFDLLDEDVLPRAVQDATIVGYKNDFVYAIGGCGDGLKALNTFFQYNVESRTCSEMASMNEARWGCMAFIWNRVLFVLGGRNSKGYLSSVETFPLDRRPNASWTLTTNEHFLPEGRAFGVTFVAGEGEIIVAGGRGGKDGKWLETFSHHGNADAIANSSTTTSSSSSSERFRNHEFPPFPAPMGYYFMSVVAMPNLIFLVGGDGVIRTLAFSPTKPSTAHPFGHKSPEEKIQQGQCNDQMLKKAQQQQGPEREKEDGAVATATGHDRQGGDDSSLDMMGIQSRAELDMKIKECDKIRRDYGNELFDVDKIGQAAKAEKDKEKLLALIDSNKFPPLEELESDLKEKIDTAKKCSPKERLKLAPEMNRLQALISMERRAADRLKIPETIIANSDALYNAMLEEATEIPKLSMDYIRQITNDFRSQQLGEGGFATVYLGIDKRHAKQFAVKKFHANVLLDQSGKTILGQVDHEVKVLSQFRHDNIVRVFGYSNGNEDENVCILYEYAGGGSLAHILKTPEGRRSLTWRKRLDIAVSILSALKYLHKKDCSHRDLKPGNICFTEDCDRVVLIDFGLARLVDHVHFHHTCTHLVGWSDPYVAPEFKDQDEVLKDANGKIQFDERCEIYSYGFVLQCLILGKLPEQSETTPHSVDYLKQNADTCAGDDWNRDVLEKMSCLVRDCTLPKSKRDQRKTIDEALTILIGLQNANPRELSSEQSAIINNSQQGVSRGRDTSKPEGCCCVCTRECDAGLVCYRYSNPRHFTCNHCFTQHVKKNLGKDPISCQGRKCFARYNLHQLIGHVDNTVVADHLMLYQQNQRGA